MTTCTPRAAWGNLLRRLHFYIGLFVGPFIFFAALTGTLYVATPQLKMRCTIMHSTRMPLVRRSLLLNKLPWQKRPWVQRCVYTLFVRGWKRVKRPA